MNAQTVPFFSLERQKEAIVSQYRKTIEAIAEVGRLLLEAQRNLQEQSFNSFLDSLPFSRRSAFNFMRLYEHYQRHSATVALDSIQLSVWYHVPIGDEATLNAVIEKSKSQKVTVADVKSILATVRFESQRQQTAWQQAAETNPKFVVDTLSRGTVTDLDGTDIPLIEADPTLLRVNADQDLYESVQRQRGYISLNSKPKPSVVVTQEIISFLQGVNCGKLPALGDTIVLSWHRVEIEK